MLNTALKNYLTGREITLPFQDKKQAKQANLLKPLLGLVIAH